MVSAAGGKGRFLGPAGVRGYHVGASALRLLNAKTMDYGCHVGAEARRRGHGEEGQYTSPETVFYLDSSGDGGGGIFPFSVSYYGKSVSV